MPGKLAWVDFDQMAHARSQSILALFNERQSVDELGIGVIRDSFADSLFPGTSTIQTRLRYMLFVPWMYNALEARGISARQIEAKGREFETRLIHGLQKGNVDHTGIIGVAAGEHLQRLPSSIYWSGLGEWGIRKYQASQTQYHQDLDAIYRERKRVRQSPELTFQDGTDEVVRQASGPLTWDPNLPSPPEDFPDHVSFELRHEEAQYIQERISTACPNSLFAHLACKGTGSYIEDVPFSWEHPDYGAFPDQHKDILEQARLFSLVMHGASLLYNLLLARECRSDEAEERHRTNLAHWQTRLDFGEIRTWSRDLTPFWQCVDGQEHAVGKPTRDFVAAWINLVADHGPDVIENIEAHRLIRRREQFKKGPNSRFRNKRALDQWGGDSGTDRLTFRWPNARTLLNDLYDGLKKG